MSAPKSSQTDRGDAARATGIDSGYAAPGVAASVGAGCDELSESDWAPECGRTSCPPEAAPGADTACWWAMSAVYNRSMKAKAALAGVGVRCFVPMRWEERTAGRRKVRRRVPAVHNLIFVRTDAAGIRALKESLPYLQYLMRREEGRATPVVVPEEQMRHFIAVAGSDDERTMFVQAACAEWRCGDRVRICGGAFAGVEGRLMKVRGTRSRRVVVAIDGVAAVATAALDPALIERIG